MRRILHGHGVLLIQLVIVNQFNGVGISIGETENDTPVRPDGYRPKTLHIAFQRMEVKAAHTHIVDGCGFIELGKDSVDLIHEVGANAGCIILLKEPFQALAPKADYRTQV
jgi:hypothetical protein